MKLERADIIFDFDNYEVPEKELIEEQEKEEQTTKSYQIYIGLVFLLLLFSFVLYHYKKQDYN